MLDTAPKFINGNWASNSKIAPRNLDLPASKPHNQHVATVGVAASFIQHKPEVSHVAGYDKSPARSTLLDYATGTEFLTRISHSRAHRVVNGIENGLLDNL